MAKGGKILHDLLALFVDLVSASHVLSIYRYRFVPHYTVNLLIQLKSAAAFCSDDRIGQQSGLI